MAERRVDDEPADAPCTHAEHRPAKHLARAPGEYEHECPGCGDTHRFTVTHRGRLG